MLPIRQTVDRPPSLPPVQVVRNDDRPEPNLARFPARSLAPFPIRECPPTVGPDRNRGAARLVRAHGRLP
ncbi:MAG: hypothetical protein WA895_36725, partial [Streptosporangiaceae bacterium]